MAQRSPTRAVRDPAVRVSASTTTIVVGDSDVTFTARLRPDVAVEIARAKGEDPLNGPRIIGWHWIPDLDNIDPFTKVCAAKELTCSMPVLWSGTMVFSIQIQNQLCADWVHIQVTTIPDLDEKDSMPRIQFDSIHKAMKTKSPSWNRCTV